MKTNTCWLNAVFFAFWMASGMPAEASITTNYGDFEASTVWYHQVSESTDYGWYGSPLVTGNTLNFTPLGLMAESSGGGLDTVNNALLSFDIRAKAGHSITAFNFSEGGDFSMVGLGTDSTYVGATANFIVKIYEVDGVVIDTVTESVSMLISPNADGTFQFKTDGEGLPIYQDLWSGAISVNLDDILNNNGVSYDDGATFMNVHFENILMAGSEPGTSALINTKMYNGFSFTTEIIPEPSSLALMAGIGSLIAYIRRKVHFMESA